MVTRDNLRFKYWHQIKEVLRVLRTRDLAAILDDLRVDTPPPSHKPTKADYAKTATERARKLRELEERRVVEREQRKAKYQAARQKEEIEMQAAQLRRRLGKPEPGVIIDASLFVTRTRQPVDPNDVSDLL